MTIERIDSSKVLISLCFEDMKDFSLRFDTIGFRDPHSRKILNRLLTLACNKTGLSIQNRSLLVEALPHESGCLILLTVKQKAQRKKVYKIKKVRNNLCYSFTDSNDFLDAICLLYKERPYNYSNSAYFYSNKYYLMFDYPSLPKRMRIILNEFAAPKKWNKVFAAKLKEAGVTLALNNAIEFIGKKF